MSDTLVSEQRHAYPLLSEVADELTPLDTGIDQLGEGPVWDARRSCLWWVDIMGGRLHRWDQAGFNAGLLTTWQHPTTVGAVMIRGSQVFLATARGVEEFDPMSGNCQVEWPIELADGNRRANDSRLDRHSQMWVGTMRLDAGTGPDDGVLYRIDRDGLIVEELSGLGCPNGMAWPTRDSMLFIDSLRRRIDRYLVDPDTGAIVEETGFIDLARFNGIPDGMHLNRDSSFWVAFWDGAMVRKFDPTGKLLAEVEVPNPRPTCPLVVDGVLVIAVADGPLHAVKRN